MSEWQSLAVENPEIPEVLDMNGGETIGAAETIGDDYAKAIQLRMELRASIAREQPKFLCPICHVPVYLVSRKEGRRFFFRHQIEDGRCSARTRGELSEKEIDARRYNGAKESRDHLRMKEIIAESIACDPRFSPPKTEETWKGSLGEWRRPDVQAKFGDLRMAFEIQLSTTYIRVIAERREFYLREGGLLVWLFKRFDESDNRLTQDDVFYNNNRNVFLASEETLAASKAAGKLCLECRWTEPVSEGGSIVLHWQRKIVSIDELTVEAERQRIYFYDFDEAVTRLSAEPKSARDETLRRRFEAFWLDRAERGRSNGRDELRLWNGLRKAFDEVGLKLTTYPGGEGSETLLNALYSAKHGRIVGWNFKKFIEIAHRLAGGHKPYLWAFRLALSAYDRRSLIRSEDQSGLWQKKVDQYKPLMEQGSSEYQPDRRFDGLVAFLFPEIADGLGKYPPPGPRKG
jgi:competence CoiA-like predicted nuclease